MLSPVSRHDTPAPPDPELVARVVNARLVAARAVRDYRATTDRPRSSIDVLEARCEAIEGAVYLLAEAIVTINSEAPGRAEVAA